MHSELSAAGFSSAVLKALEARACLSQRTRKSSAIPSPTSPAAARRTSSLPPTSNRCSMPYRPRSTPGILSGSAARRHRLGQDPRVHPTRDASVGRRARRNHLGARTRPRLADGAALQEHFGEAVAVLHSQLSAGERYDTWRRLRRRSQRVLIGARSAILAPVDDLGLIVVDEEHDTCTSKKT